MLKKTIKFTDFDGIEREETFYFNLTKAEVAEMELSEKGGLGKLLEKIVAEKDNGKILDYFKDFIKRSYGEKSLDGRKFMKSPEILADFMATEAYSVLFMELAENPDAAAKFVNAIIPDLKSK